MLKYINCPETSLYHKGKTLYLFHQAKTFIRQENCAVVVEGYFDALSCHFYGFKNTVASLGTALTRDQLKLLKRFCNEVIFAFDADRSGQEAASRSIVIALEIGFKVWVVEIPSGKDPDETLKEDPKQWENAIKDRQDVIDYELQKARKSHSITDPYGKKAIAETLFKIIQYFKDPFIVEEYLKKLSFELQTAEKSLFAAYKRFFNQQQNNIPQSVPPEILASQQVKTTHKNLNRIEYLIGLISVYPKIWLQADMTFPPSEIASETEKNLYNKIIEFYNPAANTFTSEDISPDTEEGASLPLESTVSRDLISLLAPDEVKKLQFLQMFTQEKCQHFTTEEIQQEMKNVSTHITKSWRTQQLTAARHHLATLSTNSPEYQQALNEYNSLIKGH